MFVGFEFFCTFFSRLKENLSFIKETFVKTKRSTGHSICPSDVRVKGFLQWCLTQFLLIRNYIPIHYVFFVSYMWKRPHDFLLPNMRKQIYLPKNGHAHIQHNDNNKINLLTNSFLYVVKQERAFTTQDTENKVSSYL